MEAKTKYAAKKDDHISEEELQDALEMLGMVEERAFEIHPPAVFIGEGRDGKAEAVGGGTWIKLSTSFLKTMRKIKGAKLSVWLAIALRINTQLESYPSIALIQDDTGLSNHSVITAVRELEDLGLLTVRRGEKKHNIYHINYFAAFGVANPENPFSEKITQVNSAGADSEVFAPELGEKGTKSSLKQEEQENKNKRNSNDGSVFKFFEQEIGPLTSVVGEELKDLAETYTDEWLHDAIAEASKMQHRNVKYIAGILRNWKTRGREDQRPRKQQGKARVQVREDETQEQRDARVNGAISRLRNA